MLSPIPPGLDVSHRVARVQPVCLSTVDFTQLVTKLTTQLAEAYAPRPVGLLTANADNHSEDTANTPAAEVELSTLASALCNTVGTYQPAMHGRASGTLLVVAKAWHSLELLPDAVLWSIRRDIQESTTTSTASGKLFSTSSSVADDSKKSRVDTDELRAGIRHQRLRTLVLLLRDACLSAEQLESFVTWAALQAPLPRGVLDETAVGHVACGSSSEQPPPTHTATSSGKSSHTIAVSSDSNDAYASAVALATVVYALVAKAKTLDLEMNALRRATSPSGSGAARGDGLASSTLAATEASPIVLLERSLSDLTRRTADVLFDASCFLVGLLIRDNNLVDAAGWLQRMMDLVIADSEAHSRGRSCDDDNPIGVTDDHDESSQGRASLAAMVPSLLSLLVSALRCQSLSSFLDLLDAQAEVLVELSNQSVAADEVMQKAESGAPAFDPVAFMTMLLRHLTEVALERCFGAQVSAMALMTTAEHLESLHLRGPGAIAGAEDPAAARDSENVQTAVEVAGHSMIGELDHRVHRLLEDLEEKGATNRGAVASVSVQLHLAALEQLRALTGTTVAGEPSLMRSRNTQLRCKDWFIRWHQDQLAELTRQRTCLYSSSSNSVRQGSAPREASSPGGSPMRSQNSSRGDSVNFPWTNSPSRGGGNGTEVGLAQSAASLHCRAVPLHGVLLASAGAHESSRRLPPPFRNEADAERAREFECLIESSRPPAGSAFLTSTAELRAAMSTLAVNARGAVPQLIAVALEPSTSCGSMLAVVGDAAVPLLCEAEGLEIVLLSGMENIDTLDASVRWIALGNKDDVGDASPPSPPSDTGTGAGGAATEASPLAAGVPDATTATQSAAPQSVAITQHHSRHSHQHRPGLLHRGVQPRGHPRHATSAASAAFTRGLLRHWRHQRATRHLTSRYRRQEPPAFIAAFQAAIVEGQRLLRDHGTNSATTASAASRALGATSLETGATSLRNFLHEYDPHVHGRGPSTLRTLSEGCSVAARLYRMAKKLATPSRRIPSSFTSRETTSPKLTSRDGLAGSPMNQGAGVPRSAAGKEHAPDDASPLEVATPLSMASPTSPSHDQVASLGFLETKMWNAAAVIQRQLMAVCHLEPVWKSSVYVERGVVSYSHFMWPTAANEFAVAERILETRRGAVCSAVRRLDYLGQPEAVEQFLSEFESVMPRNSLQRFQNKRLRHTRVQQQRPVGAAHERIHPHFHRALPSQDPIRPSSVPPAVTASLEAGKRASSAVAESSALDAILSRLRYNVALCLWCGGHVVTCIEWLLYCLQGDDFKGSSKSQSSHPPVPPLLPVKGAAAHRMSALVLPLCRLMTTVLETADGLVLFVNGLSNALRSLPPDTVAGALVLVHHLVERYLSVRVCHRMTVALLSSRRQVSHLLGMEGQSRFVHAAANELVVQLSGGRLTDIHQVLRDGLPSQASSWDKLTLHAIVTCMNFCSAFPDSTWYDAAFQAHARDVARASRGEAPLSLRGTSAVGDVFTSKGPPLSHEKQQGQTQAQGDAAERPSGTAAEGGDDSGGLLSNLSRRLSSIFRSPFSSSNTSGCTSTDVGSSSLPQPPPSSFQSSLFGTAASMLAGGLQARDRSSGPETSSTQGEHAPSTAASAYNDLADFFSDPARVQEVCDWVLTTPLIAIQEEELRCACVQIDESFLRIHTVLERCGGEAEAQEFLLEQQSKMVSAIHGLAQFPSTMTAALGGSEVGVTADGESAEAPQPREAAASPFEKVSQDDVSTIGGVVERGGSLHTPVDDGGVAEGGVCSPASLGHLVPHEQVTAYVPSVILTNVTSAVAEAYAEKDNEHIASASPSLLSAKERALIHEQLPMQLQSVPWRVVYSTRHHGTSYRQLLANCLDVKSPLLLVLEVAQTASSNMLHESTTSVFHLGALVPNGIRLGHQKFFGGTDTFVFSCAVDDEATAVDNTTSTTNATKDGSSIGEDGSDELAAALPQSCRSGAATAASSTAPPPANPFVHGRHSHNEGIHVYRWTHENEYFVNCRPDYVAVGGGGKGAAIFLDQSLTTGSTSACPTFASPPLTALMDAHGRVSSTPETAASSGAESAQFDVYAVEVLAIGVSSDNDRGPATRRVLPSRK